jgi:hypothetical protein
VLRVYAEGRDAEGVGALLTAGRTLVSLEK